MQNIEEKHSDIAVLKFIGSVAGTMVVTLALSATSILTGAAAPAFFIGVGTITGFASVYRELKKIGNETSQYLKEAVRE